jgi:hypothetical protein
MSASDPKRTSVDRIFRYAQRECGAIGRTLSLLRKYQLASRLQFLWQHTVIDKLVYGGRDIYCPS